MAFAQLKKVNKAIDTSLMAYMETMVMIVFVTS